MQPHEIQERRFATTFRGYEPAEVRQFLAQVAGLYADLQGRTVVVDEKETILSLLPAESLGTEQHADVLDARLTAPEPSALSLAAVEELRLHAQREADDLVAAARAEAQTIVTRANDEAARVVLRARAESRGKPSAERSAAIEAALAEVPVDPEQARDQARLMITEARAVRERILADLAKRRRTAHVQLEQLRVAREKLLETFRDARRVVEDASRDLSTAEVEARLAAETAGRRVAGEPVPTVEELEAELFGGRFLTSSTSSGRPLVAERAVVTDAGDDYSDEPDEPDEPDAPAEVAAAAEVVEVVEVADVADIAEVADVADIADVADVADIAPVADNAPVADIADSGASVTPAVTKPASVDDLFARLRVERTEAADRARVLLAEAATVPRAGAKSPSPGAKRIGGSRSTKAPSAAVAGSPAATDEEGLPVVLIDVTSASADGSGQSVETVTSVDSVESEADVPPDFGRDPGAIADLVAQRLARGIKRHLRDEQGSALVALRTARGFPALEALIGSEDVHRGRLHDAVGAALADAGAPLSADQLTDVTVEIVTAIRVEFAAALDHVGSGLGDVADLPERIASAYRVWTTERLDILIRQRSSVAALS